MRKSTSKGPPRKKSWSYRAAWSISWCNNSIPMQASKRHLLALLASAPVLGATLGLGGCGFALRGRAQYAFGSLYLQAPEGSELGRSLLRQLAASSHDLRLLLPPSTSAEADVTLHLLGERSQRVVLAKTVAGQVRELQLRLFVRFSLTGKDGRSWVEDTEIGQTRDMSYSETLTLAKDDEEAGLMRDMRLD